MRNQNRARCGEEAGERSLGAWKKKFTVTSSRLWAWIGHAIWVLQSFRCYWMCGVPLSVFSKLTNKTNESGGEVDEDLVGTGHPSGTRRANLLQHQRSPHHSRDTHFGSCFFFFLIGSDASRPEV